LLSIFSTDPPNKKKRFEDKALEGFVLEHELELNVEHVSGSSSAQSTATTKHIAPIYEIQMPSCSSSSTGQFEIGLINKRDPAHGPSMAIVCFGEGLFQPRDFNFPKTDGRKFRPECYKIFSWLEYSLLTDKAFCFVCRSFYNSEGKNNAEDVFTLIGFSK
jgi:hypothetical protein